jgi:hypothetical protein
MFSWNCSRYRKKRQNNFKKESYYFQLGAPKNFNKNMKKVGIVSPVR